MIVDPTFFQVWCDVRRLTPAERAVLRTAVDGTSVHSELASRLGVKVCTIKRQAHVICEKTGAPTLRDAVVMVLRSALADPKGKP